MDIFEFHELFEALMRVFDGTDYEKLPSCVKMGSSGLTYLDIEKHKIDPLYEEILMVASESLRSE